MAKGRATETFQFSLRSLLIASTACCVVLAIPGGYVLLVVALIWALLAAAITWVLWKFKQPINRTLAGSQTFKQNKL